MSRPAVGSERGNAETQPGTFGDKSTWVVWSLILLYITTFGVLASRRHLAFETGAFDLGNYDQAMWNAAHGRGLALTTVPTLAFNRMGLHVEPILFLIVPLYWLWSSPLLLLWLQTLALGLAAWPLFLLARRRLEADWPAVVIVLAYLLLPATESVNLFDFHAVALSPPLMLAALYFLDKSLVERDYSSGIWWRWLTNDERPTTNDETLRSTAYGLRWPVILTALFFVLAMATKEDISLHVFMIGLYLGLLLRHWRVGIFLAVVGLIWAFISFGVVIPAYRVGNEQSAYVEYFLGLGRTPLEIALSIFTRPAAVWQLLVTPENIAALRMIIVPFAGLNLIGWPIFILTAPTLAISFLSNNPLQKELETWHYTAPILPFLALAAVDGLARLRAWLGHQPAAAWTQPGLTALLLIMALSYHYLRGYSPLSKPFHWPEITNHQRLGEEIAAAMPPEAAVLAEAELVPHLSQREQVAIWAGDLSTKYEYVMLDVSHPKFFNRDNAQANLISTMVYKHEFGLTVTKDGYFVLKRGAERLPVQEGFQSFLFADPSWRERPALAQFGELFALVGVETHTNREAEPEVTLYFHVLQQPEVDYFIRLYLLNEAGEPVGETVFQQPTLIHWPTHLWRPGDVIKVRFNTLPWWTGDGQQNQFSYAVAIVSGEERWDVVARLPVTGRQALPDNLAYVHGFYRLAGMAYPSNGTR